MPAQQPSNQAVPSQPQSNQSAPAAAPPKPAPAPTPTPVETKKPQVQTKPQPLPKTEPKQKNSINLADSSKSSASKPPKPSKAIKPPKLPKVSLPGKFKWTYLLGGLAVLLLVLGLVYFFILNPYSTPQRIRVTNITDRSATVSWVTSRATVGVVTYADAEFGLPGALGCAGADQAYDDRDVTEARLAKTEGLSEEELEELTQEELDEVEVSSKGKYYMHHVTVYGLDPEKTYYFRVGNGLLCTEGEGKFADDVFTASETAQFATFSELEQPTMPDPTYGSVVSGSDIVVDGVLFMSPGLGRSVSPLSGILNDEGRWYVDLSASRTSDGELVLDFSEESDKELLMVEGGPFGTSGEVIVPMSDDTPVRAIDLASESTE